MRMSRCCLWCRGSVFGLVCMPSCHCCADSAAGQAGAHAAPAALRWRGAPGWPRARARLRGAAPGAAGAGILSPAGSPAAAPASGANTSAASAPSPAATSSRSRATGSLNTRGLPTSSACARLGLGDRELGLGRHTHRSLVSSVDVLGPMQVRESTPALAGPTSRGGRSGGWDGGRAQRVRGAPAGIAGRAWAERGRPGRPAWRARSG